MSDALSSRRQQELVLSGIGSLDDLDDVIAEILSWLPVKSLLRFRCVCKAWHALISESYFVDKHLHRTKINLLLKRKSHIFRSIEYQALLNCLSNDGPILSRELDYPLMNLPVSIKPGTFNWVLIGSCNGLVCILIDWFTKLVMLWNLCTRISQVLPQPCDLDFDLCCFGFGYDSTTDDYKVILNGGDYSSDQSVVVFTVKTGSWGKVKSVKNFAVSGRAGYLVNEALHWVSGKYDEDNNYIYSNVVSFDLAEEKVHEIALPFPPNPVVGDIWRAEVGTLRNCLALHVITMYDRGSSCDLKIWVMKEYGVKESWTQVIYIPSENLPEHDYFCMTCISESGEVLMGSHRLGSLIMYNSKKFRILPYVIDGWDRMKKLPM